MMVLKKEIFLKKLIVLKKEIVLKDSPLKSQSNLIIYHLFQSNTLTELIVSKELKVLKKVIV